MIQQSLGFYPDIDKCIQGCLHCPRSIQNIGESNIISRISDIQMEVVRKILKAFEHEGNQNLSSLNLSGYLGSYDFELFSDLGDHDIKQIYFNLGTLGNESIEFLDKFNSKFKKIFPKSSVGNIELYGNLQHSSGIFTEEDLEKLHTFFRKYVDIVQEENKRLNNQNETHLLLAANNIRNKNFQQYKKKLFRKSPIYKLLSKLHNINLNSLSRDQIKKTEPSFLNLEKAGLVMCNSKIIKEDGSWQTIDFRGINAKIVQEKDFKNDILDVVQDNSKLIVDVFPDKIVVYHNTKHINQNIYWFNYQEFLKILDKTLSEKLRLKDEIDLILLKRLKNI